MTAIVSHTRPEARSEAAKSIPEARSTPDHALRDRPRASDPNIVGTRCDQTRHSSHIMAPSHEGCPGWWGQHVNDLDALTCACDCHEEQYGWPHWDQAIERLLRFES